MRQCAVILSVSILASLGVGCSTVAPLQLNAPPTRNPIDETSASPDLAAKEYRRIMVIPPSGSTRGQFDEYINLFEREFLNNGITVISSAITGRVVMEGGAQRKDEAAQALSDAERALVMAKSTNANALLQIGSLEWTPDYPSRLFVNRNQRLEEAQSPAEYDGWVGEKMKLTTSILTFVGRLTDVESGEVMASFSVRCATGWDLPAEYVAEIRFVNGSAVVEKENWSFSPSTKPQAPAQGGFLFTAVVQPPARQAPASAPGSWEAEAKVRVLRKTIAIVANHIKGK